ncbi:MAG: ABC transporter ATP-binding protein [Antricoccus sp.]
MAVKIDGLRVVRGRQVVLPQLSLSISAGQVVGLLGPSGSGKTTLLRAIVGVQQVAEGTITVLGSPAGSAALRSRVGYVTQAPSIYADLTVRQNIGYFAAVQARPKSAVDEVIAQVDLLNYADNRVEDLSGGERSRVSLAAALVGEPELLVLDEPTVGLDPVLRRDLWELFGRLADRGKTLLISSHVMDEARRCDRLLLLREGELLADETPLELLAETGAADTEQAFLRLIERAGTPA